MKTKIITFSVTVKYMDIKKKKKELKIILHKWLHSSPPNWKSLVRFSLVVNYFKRIEKKEKKLPKSPEKIAFQLYKFENLWERFKLPCSCGWLWSNANTFGIKFTLWRNYLAWISFHHTMWMRLEYLGDFQLLFSPLDLIVSG